jgi:hypothetical protein
MVFGFLLELFYTMGCFGVRKLNGSVALFFGGGYTPLYAAGKMEGISGSLPKMEYSIRMERETEFAESESATNRKNTVI